MRPLHFLDDAQRPVPVESHRAVINANTGQRLGVVGASYRLVTNAEALEMARRCAAALFGASHDNLEVFHIHIPPTRPSFCRIDLIQPGYELNVLGGGNESYRPFLRLTNSYNASRALRFDIGFCRAICTNGLIFSAEAIAFHYSHCRESIPAQFDWKSIVGESRTRLESIRRRFQVRAARLQQFEVEPVLAVPLLFKALNLPLPKSRADYQKRAGTLFGPLHQTACELVGKYEVELGPNAYGLFNAVTDFASRPPALREFRRAEHALQTRAGTWLEEFDALLEETPQPDLARYLGEYAEVARWN